MPRCDGPISAPHSTRSGKVADRPPACCSARAEPDPRSRSHGRFAPSPKTSLGTSRVPAFPSLGPTRRAWMPSPRRICPSIDALRKAALRSWRISTFPRSRRVATNSWRRRSDSWGPTPRPCVRFCARKRSRVPPESLAPRDGRLRAADRGERTHGRRRAEKTPLSGDRGATRRAAIPGQPDVPDSNRAGPGTPAHADGHKSRAAQGGALLKGSDFGRPASCGGSLAR